VAQRFDMFGFFRITEAAFACASVSVSKKARPVGW
jgi:hypothetical protein